MLGKKINPWPLGFCLRGGDLFEPVQGGIDGRVGPRTGASERIVLAHCAATRRGCVCFGVCLFESFCWNIRPGNESSVGFMELGTGYGIYLWVSNNIGFGRVPLLSKYVSK